MTDHRKTFVEILTNLSREDIDNIISQKGKPPKSVNPIVFVKDVKKDRF